MKGLYFLVGGIMGGAAGFFAAKKYYTGIMEEELAKQKEYYKKVDEDLKKREEHVEEKYDEALSAMREYAGVSDEEEEMVEEEYPGEKIVHGEPYVISPSELEEQRDHEVVYLTWYENDHILARNEVDFEERESDIITDIEGTIGPDALDRFGEFEADTVFVRDDRISVDYIIEREETAYDYD